MTKNVNSAFIGTELEGVLMTWFAGAGEGGIVGGGEAKGGGGVLYIAGLSTDHCVSTTTRMAANLGVCDGREGEKGEVVLVEDATACWKKSEGGFEAEVVHGVNVESLREFATVRGTGEVLEGWEMGEGRVEG